MKNKEISDYLSAGQKQEEVKKPHYRHATHGVKGRYEQDMRLAGFEKHMLKCDELKDQGLAGYVWKASAKLLDKRRNVAPRANRGNIGDLLPDMPKPRPEDYDNPITPQELEEINARKDSMTPVIDANTRDTPQSTDLEVDAPIQEDFDEVPF